MRPPRPESGDTLPPEMEENSTKSASAAQNAANRVQSPRATTTQCVLLSAGTPPADLRRALDHKHINASIARSPEVAIAMLVRAEQAARQSGRRVPSILVCVEPDALGASGERLLRCVHLYAPHAVCWRFDQGQSPQLRAWAPAPVAPVVRPAPKPPAADPPPPRAEAEPRLRLVGEQSFRAPPPPPPAGVSIFVGPGIPLAPGTKRNPPTPEGEPESPPPPVSDAELSMLLSGERPTDPRGPRRT